VGSTPEFTVRTESRNGVAYIALTGELDGMTAPTVRHELTAYEGNDVGTLMFDLRELTFIDSSGIHLFVEAKARATSNGHRVMLVGVTSTVRRLIELTGTQFLLDNERAVGALDQFTKGHPRREGQSAVAGVKMDA